MDYFSLEILDYFSKKTGKPLRLLEQGEGALKPQGHVVYSTSQGGAFAKPLKGNEQELIQKGFNPSNVESQAGQGLAQASQIKSTTGSVIYAWRTGEDEGTQEVAPEEPSKIDALEQQLTASLPQYQVLTPVAIELLGAAFPSFLQTTLAGIMADRTKGAEASRNILQTILNEVGLGACIFNVKTLKTVDSELGIPKDCVPKNLQARELLKASLLDKLQQRIFFQAAGAKQRSLADRLATASVIKIDESGKLDLQSRIDPLQSQQEVQKIFEKLMELASKETLDSTDITFIKNKVQYLGGRDKIILYSEDGRLAVSFGNSGAVGLLSRWLEEKYIQSSPDEKGKLQIEGLSVKKLNEESYSSLLGDLVEDLTNLEIREQRYAGLIAQCKTNNPELCAQFQKDYENIRLERAKVYVKLSSSCKILMELGGADKDLIGESEKVEQINSFHDQIKELAANEGINVNDPKELDKIIKTAIQVGTFATVMIQQQKAVKLADWSVVTGQKRGANRKADLALFYFDENKARSASESTGEVFESYDINDPKLASIFEDDVTDPTTTSYKEYSELKSIASQRCAGKVPCMVHTIRPSLKTKVGKKGETTLGTTSAENTDDICELIISEKDQGYSDTFNKKYQKNLRKLEQHEAQQLRETVIQRAESVGIPKNQAIEAVKKVKEYNAKLLRISQLAAKIDTVTQGGKPVTADGAEKVIDMFGDIRKEIEIDLKTVESKDATKVKNLLDSARKHAEAITKIKDPEARQKREKLMKETLMEATYYLQNARRKKLANERDSNGNLTKRAMEERRAFGMELMVRGGSSKNSTVVIESNFRERTSNTFIHNDVVQAHIEDLMSGKGEIKLLANGFGISADCHDSDGGCWKEGDRATMSITSDFSGGSAGSYVSSVNGNSVERRSKKRKQGFEGAVGQRENYNIKLSLIKEMLEQQKELLLKIISPEV